MYISPTRLYADKDGNLVDEKDPKKAYLVVGAGGNLSDEDARRYGLIEAPEEKAVTEPKTNKAIGKAPANKGKV